MKAITTTTKPAPMPIPALTPGEILFLLLPINEGEGVFVLVICNIVVCDAVTCDTSVCDVLVGDASVSDVPVCNATVLLAWVELEPVELEPVVCSVKYGIGGAALSILNDSLLGFWQSMIPNVLEQQYQRLSVAL